MVDNAVAILENEVVVTLRQISASLVTVLQIYNVSKCLKMCL